jgi:hypothetical protein
MEFSSRQTVLYLNEPGDQQRLMGILYRFEIYFDTVEVGGSSPASPSSFFFLFQLVERLQQVGQPARKPRLQ